MILSLRLAQKLNRNWRLILKQHGLVYKIKNFYCSHSELSPRGSVLFQGTHLIIEGGEFTAKQN